MGLIGVSVAGVAHAQADDGDGGEFELAIESVGIGGLSRAGSWTAVSVRFIDRGEEPREVLLEVRGRDADGDTPLYQRAMTSNPGRDQRAWVYAYLQHGRDRSEPLIVTAYEAVEDGGAPSGFSPGRTLGRTGQTLDRMVDPGVGIAVVVGTTPGGLRRYSDRVPGSGRSWRERGHETTEIAGELEPDELPDRWVGLLGVEVLIWTDASPGGLSERRAEAVSQWVERGGRLVVVPGSRSDEWLRSGTGVASLVSGIRTVESEPRLVRSLITDEPVDPPPGGFQVVAFEEETNSEGEPSGFVPILNDLRGRPVVVQKRVGFGSVTLAGIDLASTRLADRDRPTARSFWSRVLGWREGLEPVADDSAGAPIIGGRRPAVLDDGVGSQVAMSGAAAAGVLVGLVTFGVYFAVAGPLAFLVLKRMNQTAHAWSAYLVAGAVFAGVAWGAATALRPREPIARYLGFVDFVGEERRSRVRLWSSVLLPAYGQGTIGLTDDSGGDVVLGEGGVVAPWRSPRLADSLVGRAFPDARPYAVDGRGDGAMVAPARSTVKQMRADWMGASRDWRGFEVVGEGGLGGGRITLDGSNQPSGVVRHMLPVALRDVVVLVNLGQRAITSTSRDRLVFNGRVYQLSGEFDPWDPGEELDLGLIAQSVPAGDAAADGYFDGLARRTELVERTIDDLLDVDIAGQLTAANWVSLFAPPLPSGDPADLIVAQRLETFGYDLGEWATRPCVIVIGHAVVEEDDEGVRPPAPLGVRLNGGGVVEPDGVGRAVVRWVYPLDARPPRWAAE